MTFFFFVVGLEARREFDLGELRDRRWSRCRWSPGVGGMVVTARIYLAINAGHGVAHGWGVAMSTDTAFALGTLALVGPRFSDRLRAFLLTVLGHRRPRRPGRDRASSTAQPSTWSPLLVAVGVFALIAGRRPGADPRRSASTSCSVCGAWVAMFESGVDPIVVGLAMGLLTYAAPAGRGDLERRAISFADSGSSRRRSSPAPPGSGSSPRSRRTSACSTCTTRGRAT